MYSLSPLWQILAFLQFSLLQTPSVWMCRARLLGGVFQVLDIAENKKGLCFAYDSFSLLVVWPVPSSLQEPGWWSSRYLKSVGQCEIQKRQVTRRTGVKLLPGSGPWDLLTFSLSFFFASFLPSFLPSFLLSLFLPFFLSFTEISHMVLPELKWQKSTLLPQEREPNIGRVSLLMTTLAHVSLHSEGSFSVG